MCLLFTYRHVTMGRDMLREKRCPGWLGLDIARDLVGERYSSAFRYCCIPKAKKGLLGMRLRTVVGCLKKCTLC